MKFRVELYGTFRGLVTNYSIENGIELETQDDFSIRDVLERLGIEPRATMLIINGAVVKPTTMITEGDTIKVFPLLAGG